MRRILLSLVIALAAVGAPAHAVPVSDCKPDEAFQNDQVSIWFQGFKGHIKVDNKSDNASYDFKTVALTERTDAGPLATMNLERAYPQETGTCTVVQDGSNITITFGVTADVRRVGDGAQAPADPGGNVLGQATVTFVFHFNADDDGAKFDLKVDNWPWQSTASTLAFDLDVTATGATIEPAENGIGFRDSDGNARGHISWDSAFTVTYADGSRQDGTVQSTTTVDGSTASARLDFTGVSAGYTNLLYDPWMGVGPYVVLGPILLGTDVITGLLPALPSVP